MIGPEGIGPRRQVEPIIGVTKAPEGPRKRVPTPETKPATLNPRPETEDDNIQTPVPETDYPTYDSSGRLIGRLVAPEDLDEIPDPEE